MFVEVVGLIRMAVGRWIVVVSIVWEEVIVGFVYLCSGICFVVVIGIIIGFYFIGSINIGRVKWSNLFGCVIVDGIIVEFGIVVIVISDN